MAFKKRLAWVPCSTLAFFFLFSTSNFAIMETYIKQFYLNIHLKSVKDISDFYDKIGQFLLNTKMSDIEDVIFIELETALLKVSNHTHIDSLPIPTKEYVENIYCKCSTIAMRIKWNMETTDRAFFKEITQLKDMILNHPLSINLISYNLN